jgi:protein-L-isoaspartate O-methyltransferase
MNRMTLSDFEARYQAEPDPWGYTTSGYERDKYTATLAACGPGPFAHALELGGSIGVFSAMLAPRCHRLTTIDAAPTAVELARQRLAGANMPGLLILHGTIPGEIPDGPYDLVVASEILYYLAADELEATLDRLYAQTRRGARIVAVHWREDGPERPLRADDVHATLRRRPWLQAVVRADTDEYRLDVLERP